MRQFSHRFWQTRAKCGLLTMGYLASSEAPLILNIHSVRCIDGCAAALLETMKSTISS
jgi:hypothetical protein